MLNWAARLPLIALALFVTFAASASAYAQEKRSVAYVVPIEGVIDLGLAPFVQRVLDQATLAGAAAVVLEINTFGGRVDVALQIRDARLNSRVRTLAYVNKRAMAEAFRQGNMGLMSSWTMRSSAR